MTTPSLSPSNSRLAAVFGLVVAFGGTLLLVSPVAGALGDPQRLSTRVLYQLALWGLFALIVAIVSLWEKQSLGSIGLGRLSWASIGLGLGCAALMIAVNSVVIPFLTKFGIVDLSKGFAVVASWPVWLRLFAAVTAGVVEEVLFRGYAIERLALLIRSYAWAGVISLMIFAAVHLPFWGLGILFNAFFGGAVSTLLYLWRRDLWACIIAHSALDAIALIADPAIRHGGS